MRRDLHRVYSLCKRIVLKFVLPFTRVSDSFGVMATGSRSTGNHCAVFGCNNNFRKRKILAAELCDEHGQPRHQCGCGLFLLPRFPRDEEQQRLWVASVNRKGFVPTAASRVCSVHFVDGKRSSTNPTPMLHLGYQRKVGGLNYILVSGAFLAANHTLQLPYAG